MTDKQIIILFNGTSNDDHDPALTNIVNIRDGLVQDNDQWVLYRDGMGNDQQWTRPFSRLFSQFSGYGGRTIIDSAYTELLKSIKNAIKSSSLQNGDNLHLSVAGFSRGAALARHFAIEYIHKKLQNTIQRQFSTKLFVKVQAEYLFDTVPSFGIPMNIWLLKKVGIYNQQIDLGWNFTIPPGAQVRHVVSIDENRDAFTPHLIDMKEGEDFEEIWMAGDHSDIGGGHPKQYPGEVLADENALRYVVKCCIQNRLRFNESFIASLYKNEFGLGTIHGSKLKIPSTQWKTRQIYVLQNGVQSSLLPIVAESVISRMKEQQHYRPESLMKLQRFYIQNPAGEKKECTAANLLEILETTSEPVTEDNAIVQDPMII